MGLGSHNMAVGWIQEKAMRDFNAYDWTMFSIIVAYLLVLIMVLIIGKVNNGR